jgi:hypothetical protein
MEEEAEPDIPARETEEQDMPNAEGAERSNEMEQDFEKVDLNDRSIELPALVGCQDWIRQLEEGDPCLVNGDTPTKTFAAAFSSWYHTHSKSVDKWPREKTQSKVLHHMWIMFRLQNKESGETLSPGHAMDAFFAIMGTHHYHFAVVAFCLQHGVNRICPTAPKGAILVPPGNTNDQLYSTLMEHATSNRSGVELNQGYKDTDLMNVLYWTEVIDLPKQKEMVEKARNIYDSGDLKALLHSCLNLQSRLREMGLLGAAG